MRWPNVIFMKPYTKGLGFYRFQPNQGGLTVFYPDFELEYWVSKYGLEIATNACAKCGQLFQTKVPVLIKGYAGLETETHECGRKYNSAIFTPISNDSKKIWENIFFS